MSATSLWRPILAAAAAVPPCASRRALPRTSSLRWPPIASPATGPSTALRRQLHHRALNARSLWPSSALASLPPCERAGTRFAPVATARRWQSTSSSSTASMQDRMRAMEEMQQAAYKKRNQSLMMYTAAVLLLGIGVTYAAVPFYRAFCSATGFGGTPMVSQGRFEPSRLVPISWLGDGDAKTAVKRIRVTFNSDTSDSLPWSFTPVTKEINVLPGETALAFFTAKNSSPKDIVGIATYNVAPDRIAPYFAKVECFCFEEQKLLAGEEVDLPVFFFIDRDMLEDPTVKDVDEVVLSYTFFSARRNAKNGQLEPDTDLSKYQVGMDLPGVK